MPSNVRTRLEIERELFDAVQSARARYERFSEQYTRILDDAKGIPGSDGALMLTRAVELHSAMQASIEEYRETLNKFHTVVVERRLPED